MQNYKLTFILLTFSLTMCSQEKFEWNYKNKIQNKLNREDSTKWDKKNLEIDLKKVKKSKSKIGIFPSPKYNLIGKNSFNGLGYAGNFKGLTLNGKKFVYNYFYVNKNMVNESYLKNLKHDIFFAIVVMTDFIDDKAFTHMKPNLISRNHPNYLAKGYFKTLYSKINYSAFITADRLSYAIVNSRLFDLSLGQLIVIVPQKDKSLNSYQIMMEKLQIDQIDSYIKNILSSEKIKKRYFNSKTI